MRLCLGQLRDLSEEAIAFAHQVGIKGVQFNTPNLPGKTKWEYKDLLALKQSCEDNGLVCETIENVPIQFYDKILLGLPGRDEQIKNIQEIIRNMGKVGIPILGYHFCPTFVWRTSFDSPGRGGAKVSAFDATLGDQKNKITYWARTDIKITHVEKMWDNYEYFMKAIIPVAEEAGVKLALHPDDPPVPIVADVARLFIDFESFKRAEAIANSDAWGLDLCLGCCSEMAGGAENVSKMIEYFGEKNKIFYVHFRDVQGSVPNFKECFLGEGNFNPAEVMLQLKNKGFDGYIMDDHVPKMVNDDDYGYRARGYTIGYLQGLMKMMDLYQSK